MNNNYIEEKLKEFDEKCISGNFKPVGTARIVSRRDFRLAIQQAYEKGLDDGYKGREKDMEASGGVI